MSGTLEILRKLIDTSNVDQKLKDEMRKTLAENFYEGVGDHSDTRLRKLLAHEKHCLEVVKQYKDEIKFMYSIQEEIRKEKAQFFSVTLREVSNNLANSPIESNVASQWLQELIRSYMQSLALSDSLVKTDTFDMIGEIRA